MTWKIGNPAAGSSGFDKSAHNGHLIACVEPKGEQVPKYSGEGTQLVANCSYIICIDDQLVLADVPLYGDHLAPKVVEPGEPIVAFILGQSTAKPGRSPAWIPVETTDTEKATVQEFLDKWAVTAPSGRIIVEQPPEQPPAAESGDEKF